MDVVTAAADAEDFWGAKLAGQSGSQDHEVHKAADIAFEQQYSERVPERWAAFRRGQLEMMAACVIRSDVISGVAGGWDEQARRLGFPPGDLSEPQDDKRWQHAYAAVRVCYRKLGVKGQNQTNMVKRFLHVEAVLREAASEQKLAPLLGYDRWRWSFNEVGKFKGWKEVENEARRINPSLPSVNNRGGSAEPQDDDNPAYVESDAKLRLFVWQKDELAHVDEYVLVPMPRVGPPRPTYNDPGAKVRIPDSRDDEPYFRGPLFRFVRDPATGRFEPYWCDEDGGGTWRFLTKNTDLFND